MRNAISSLSGLDVGIQPKRTSEMDPPSCLSTLGGAIVFFTKASWIRNLLNSASIRAGVPCSGCDGEGVKLSPERTSLTKDHCGISENKQGARQGKDAFFLLTCVVLFFWSMGNVLI